MVKRAIRAAIRRTRRWLEDDGVPTAFDDPAYLGEHSYPWLNVKLQQLLRDRGCAQRPHFAWGALQGVSEARTLGLDRVSLIEFGVAGGNGLVALERIAQRIEPICGVNVDVYGFDTGTGLPESVVGWQDVPNLLAAGRYRMDPDALKARLQRARLFLGRIGDTMSRFIESRPATVAFVSIDVDFYSSTLEAFALLEAKEEVLLPRVYCYFDDIMGYTYGDHNGERLAITEFNASHRLQKISKIHGLRYFVSKSFRDDPWVESMYIAHILGHSLYSRDSRTAIDRTSSDDPAVKLRPE